MPGAGAGSFKTSIPVVAFMELPTWFKDLLIVVDLRIGVEGFQEHYLKYPEA